MGASLKTTNYELPIFAANDTVGFATPNTFNTAMDKIDTQMAANAASADQAVHTANNAEASASAAQTAVGNANTNITRLNNQMAEVQSALNFSFIRYDSTGSALPGFWKMVWSSDNQIGILNFTVTRQVTVDYTITVSGSDVGYSEVCAMNGKYVETNITKSGPNYIGTPITLGRGFFLNNGEESFPGVIIFYCATENKTHIAVHSANILSGKTNGNFTGIFLNTGGIIDNGIE